MRIPIVSTGLSAVPFYDNLLAGSQSLRFVNGFGLQHGLDSRLAGMATAQGEPVRLQDNRFKRPFPPGLILKQASPNGLHFVSLDRDILCGILV